MLKENWRRPVILATSDRIAVCKSKELHSRLHRALVDPDVDTTSSLSWLQFGDLFRKTEGFVCAIMDKAPEIYVYVIDLGSPSDILSLVVLILLFLKVLVYS